MRNVAIILAAVLAMSVYGCGKKEEASATAPTAAAPAAAATPAATEQPAATATAPAAEQPAQPAAASGESK